MGKKRTVLSEPMLRALENISEGLPYNWDCVGRSEHGGRTKSFVALRSRGLVDHDHAITPAGTELLSAAKRGRDASEARNAK